MDESKSFDEELWDAATKYRSMLRRMWDEVRFASNGCKCNLRDDWDVLLDSGVDKRSPKLTIDGVTCLACRIEALYEEAVGIEVFEAEAITEIKMRLGDHSVIQEVTDDNGAVRYAIVEREALEGFDIDDWDEDDTSTD